MNPPIIQRRELCQFLHEIEPEQCRVLGIFSVELSYLKVALNASVGYLTQWRFVRIIATGAIDYAILPRNPAIIEGGPPIIYSTDDSRFKPAYQFKPGGDGEKFNPPKRYQFLQLDKTWIIAERFQVDLLALKGPLPPKAG